MPPHFVVTRYNGANNLNYEIEFFPNLNKDDPRKRENLSRVIRRYQLTEAQSKLSVNELIVLCAGDQLTLFEPRTIIVDGNTKAIEQLVKP